MDVDLDADVNSNDVTVIETGTYEDVEVDAEIVIEVNDYKRAYGLLST